MSATPETVEGISEDPLISVLSPGFLLKHYLSGLSFVDQNGSPLDSDFYVQKITVACAVLKRLTNLHVLQTVITDELHDYDSNDYQQFAFLQLFEYPVVSVQGVTVRFPTGETAINFPTEWTRLDKEHGQLRLVPTSGSMATMLIGQGGSFLPLIGGLQRLPQAFLVSYTTGFAAGKIPHDVIDTIAKLACIEIFTVTGLTVTPIGVSNISAGIDGVSQGMGFISNAQAPGAFAGWIKKYREDLYGSPQLGINGAIKDLKAQYRGVTLTSM